MFRIRRRTYHMYTCMWDDCMWACFLSVRIHAYLYFFVSTQKILERYPRVVMFLLFTLLLDNFISNKKEQVEGKPLCFSKSETVSQDQ